MERLQLGRWISRFNMDKLSACLREASKFIRGSKVVYYKSKPPLSRTFGRPTDTKVAGEKKFNHVALMKGNKKILEFFKSAVLSTGFVYGENLASKEYSDLMILLSEYQIYTFESLKMFNHPFKYTMIGLSFVLIFLASLLIFFTDVIGAKAFGLVMALFSVVILILYAEY